MLRLTYKDEEGYDTFVDVRSSEFVIGRQTSCDLSIPDDRLSRQHLKIECLNGTYYADDPGSSNGTRLNGSEMYERTELHDGDVLDLGGGARIQVSFVRERSEAAAEPESSSFSGMKTGTFKRPEMPATVAGSNNVVTASSAPEKGGIPVFVYIAAPVMAIILIVFAGGTIYLLSGSNSESNNRSQLSDEDPIEFDDEPTPKKTNSDTSEKPVTNNSGTSEPSNAGTLGTNTASDNTGSKLPEQTGAIVKVEQNAAAFMRSIAENDPKAFLTGEQAGRVSAKIDQLKGSGALAANIDSARKNSAQLATLARSINLKPRFLTVAAIAELGNQRGDVLQTARTQLPVFEKLLPSIGTEFADDAMLMIAAYDQGKAGQHLKLRNMLQALAEKTPESARSIRSIWFLSKNDKITNAEFERALLFLAIGTIVQNPKDFGVNAESLGA